MNPQPLQYAKGKPRKLRRWLICFVVLAAILAAVDRAWERAGKPAARLLWQRQCMNYIPPAGRSVWAGDPLCLRQLEPDISRGRYEMMRDGCLIFLHERTSPNGTKRLLLVQFRPNVDHAQLCSIDAFSITPGTWTVPPKSRRGGLIWVPGWWPWGGSRQGVHFGFANAIPATHLTLPFNISTARRLHPPAAASRCSIIASTTLLSRSTVGFAMMEWST